MTKSFQSEKLLYNRHPNDLSRDIKLATVLLRMGLHKSWLERDEFLNATFHMCSSLFLRTSLSVPQAIASAQEGSDEDSALLDPTVSAALLSVALEVPDEPTTSRDAQLLMTIALSISRFPRIWIASDVIAMITELRHMLIATGADITPETIRDRWQILRKKGRVLRQFERTLTGFDFTELRSMNKAAQFEKGDLSYQGPLGYMICDESASRSDESCKSMLMLQPDKSGVKKIRASFVNPVAGLIQNPKFREKLQTIGGDPDEVNKYLI
jgi:hypothetical protein